MKIHGICLVKNEADFLRFGIEANLTHFDGIYIFDNGSADGTWEEALCLQSRHPSRVFAWKSEETPFRDSLRGQVFNAFRTRAEPGDWWCRLDADEIYLDPVREFLSVVPARHHVVWSISHQYYFSAEDARKWESRPAGGTLEAMDDLPRHYRINHSEARFFRHRDRLVWSEGSWPAHLGLVHPRRIRLQHYQYRSPSQIQRRLDTRRIAAAEGYEHFCHSLESHWREKITDSSDLLIEAPPKSAPPEPPGLPPHLEPRQRRLAKFVLHGLQIWP